MSKPVQAVVVSTSPQCIAATHSHSWLVKYSSLLRCHHVLRTVTWRLLFNKMCLQLMFSPHSTHLHKGQSRDAESCSLTEQIIQNQEPANNYDKKLPLVCPFRSVSLSPVSLYDAFDRRISWCPFSTRPRHWRSRLRWPNGGPVAVRDTGLVRGSARISAEVPPSPRRHHRFLICSHRRLPPRQLQALQTG